MSLLSEGYGAIQDWRAALLFLSRLNRKRRKTEDARPEDAKPLDSRTVWLDVPQQEVIDACFREVLRGKFPTLGHRMLAALAGALRLDIILTTNFDNLLERAFETARNPLEVFEVPLEGKIPDWTTLSNTRALIKLHGGRSSLRADYSLDGQPSEEDKRTFLRYLLSAQGRDRFANGESKANPSNLQNHLLVIGFSANDRRIRALIEYAWEHLPETFCVYWICHSESDVKSITNFIPDNRKKPSKDDLRREKTVLRHTQAGLFLLQFYQSLRKTLPPLGSIFPSVARLTFPPLEPPHITEKLKQRETNVSDFTRNLKSALKNFDDKTLANFGAADWESKRVVLAYAAPRVAGITSVCARAFHALEKEDKVCLWLDLNDISSAENLFEALLEAIYYRLGFEDWIPPTIGYHTSAEQNDEKATKKDAEKIQMREDDQKRRRQREIERLIGSVNKRWVVFLNAYETPGANKSDEQDAEQSGWLDSPCDSNQAAARSRFDDRSDCREDLIRLLGALCSPESRMSVVLMCRNKDLFSENKGGKSIDAPVVELMPNQPADDTTQTPRFVAENIAVEVIQWVADSDSERSDAKKRFLHALILMQRPRHVATLWSSALSPKTLSETATLQLQWVKELEHYGLARRKYGGLIWVHSSCRQILRKLLSEKRGEYLQKLTDPSVEKKTKGVFDQWDTTKDEAEIHKDIAEWYERVLDASEAPAAAFEAAFHFCRAGLAFSKQKSPDYGRSSANIEAASSLLKANSFLIQTHGYSRGSCRRLTGIAEVGKEIFDHVFNKPAADAAKESERAEVEKAVRKLWIVFVEIMRAIAREVGEDAKAYYRHRQARKLIAENATWEEACRDDPNTTKTPVAPNFEANQADETMYEPGELRWRRWSGMLAIASRSYMTAQTLLEKAVGKFSEQKEPKELSHYQWVKEQQQRIEFLRLLEQSVELMLLQNVVARRLEDLNHAGNRPSHNLLDNAENTIKRAIKLARKVRDADTSSNSHDTIIANWCEMRLLTHRSVIVSRRRTSASPLDSVLDAMGILGDAEAKLRISDGRRSRSDIALIDLHRADARLCEAEAINLMADDKDETLTLPYLIEELENSPKNNKAGLPELQDYKGGEVNQMALARASALVADSLRFLDRAESVLRDRRRNVWWTTWFFERKLRAIALSVAASAFDKGTPIPFLGLEAAMRVTETEADHLLNDTVRMVRVDAYRLATALDAYLSCFRALTMLLKLDTGEESAQKLPLPRRRERMLAHLREARSALDVVLENRANIDAKYEQAGRLDARVSDYIEAIKQKVDRALAEKENRALLKECEIRLITRALLSRTPESNSGVNLIRKENIVKAKAASIRRQLEEGNLEELLAAKKGQSGLTRAQLAVMTGLRENSALLLAETRKRTEGDAAFPESAETLPPNTS